mgnify:FL=1
MKDIVIITCYRKTERMERGKAIEFYSEGAFACAGSSEGDRYMSIVMGLKEGLSAVDDEWEWCE